MKKIEVVIFSKNRPMQLYATLESFYLHCQDIELCSITVIYKSDPSYNYAYTQIQNNFQDVYCYEEGRFQNDVMGALAYRKYVLFVVDDCIFTNKFSLGEMQQLLENNDDALGFSLRLGRNTTYCYPDNKPNELPGFTSHVSQDNILRFSWRSVGGDFGYPFDLSSSFYRISTLVDILQADNVSYANPNQLEWQLYVYAMQSKSTYPSYLLSYKTSVAFCAPVNKVQTVNDNRTGTQQQYSVEKLLDQFNKGYSIDIKKFVGLVSNSCHREVDFDFIYNPCI